MRDLLSRPEAERTLYLDFLVPEELRVHYGLPSRGPWEADATSVFRWISLPEPRTLRIEVWPDPVAEDPALVVELTDTYLGHLEAAWLVLNDLSAPRFNLDRDDRSEPIALGSSVRNLREELRALAAGLAPNQVRAGLRMFRPLIGRIEGLAATLGVDTLYVSPLAYHNAVKYEHYGFTYASGQEELEWLHHEFGRGGVLRRRMDGSRPFRMPWMAESIRGRSWAVHDEILGRRWMAPQMYKFVGRSFSTRTCPGLRW
ncbi:MAG: hypothetical protein HZB55_10790 [Deltaproteobacteria bacterium]|nr:hypothetical protein [Deltaproteobacteria bacterium]